MRPISVAAVFFLVLSACGGSGGSPAAETTTLATESTSSTSTTRPSTTATASTTTAPSTTTTTVLPWTTLPDPGMPSAVLSADLGGPGQPESICLEVSTEGLVPPAEDLVSGLTTAFEFLGVDVRDEECAATFRLSVAGSRRSGNYTNFGTCWPGIRIVGETALLMDGEPVGHWSIDLPGELPGILISCPGPDEPIGVHRFAPQLVELPLIDMFGDLGDLAAHLGFGTARRQIDWQDGTPHDSTWPLFDEEKQALISLLLDRDPEVVDAVQEWLEDFADPGDLRPLVPYLIALLNDPDEFAGLSFILEDITGVDRWQGSWPATQRAFWRWWETYG
jgi:hypothetical protein